MDASDPTFQAAVLYTAGTNAKPGGNEGGYSNVVGDAGGITWRGVTQATAAAYGYTGTMNPIPEDIYNDICLTMFWIPNLFDQVTNPQVAIALYDGSFDGMGNAGPVFQAAAVACGADIVQDGHWGPDTLAAVNALDPDQFIAALSDAWLAYYAALVAAQPSKQKFLNGWNNRANRLLTLQSGLTGIAAQVTTTVTANPVTSSVVLGVLFLGLIFFLGKKG
jgi:lysozyme family protein